MSQFEEGILFGLFVGCILGLLASTITFMAYDKIYAPHDLIYAQYNCSHNEYYYNGHMDYCKKFEVEPHD